MTAQTQLYQQELMAHHKKPFGFEVNLSHGISALGENIACGDEISMSVVIHQAINKNVMEGSIEALAFSGDSCAICRASASMLCHYFQGASLSVTIEKVKQQVNKLAKNSRDAELFPAEFSALNVVSRFPIRKQCAALPWTTLLSALTSAIKEKQSSPQI